MSEQFTPAAYHRDVPSPQWSEPVPPRPEHGRPFAMLETRYCGHTSNVTSAAELTELPVGSEAGAASTLKWRLARGPNDAV